MTELRFAIRVLRRHPAFTAVAVTTLALGIGLNATLFGILNGLLLKPPAFAEPGSLVWLVSASPRPDAPRGYLTHPDFLALRARRDVLADAFVFAPAPLSLSTGRTAMRVTGQVVSGAMFDVLGVRMAAGRPFLPEEDRTPGTHPVTVLGHALWLREFGGDASVVGRPVVLNGQPFSVVGIAPAGFVGPDRLAPADLWVPLMMHRVALPGAVDALGPTAWWWSAIGRLASNVSRQQAAAVLAGVAGGLALSQPGSPEGFTVRVVPFLGTAPSDRRQVVPVAALILGVSLTVLLIACANLAGLLLSRAAGRQREIGIRLSIGASRAALIRQLLIESLLLAVAAGAVGLLVAMWSADALLQLAGVPATIDTTPDWRMLAFTILLAVGATLAFGLPPALRAARQDIVPALRGEPAGSDGRSTSRLQRALVVGQLAVSLVLVVGAGLFIRGLSRAWTTDVGFEYEDRVALSMDLRLQQYDTTRAAVFYPRLMEEVRALPGIREATIAHLVPFGGRVHVHRLSFPGQPADPDRRPERASVNRVWTDFFRTVGMPIIRGRDFDPSDLKSVPDTAIISETMAQQFWPGGDALGHRFSVDGPDGPFVTVVGVARDARIDEFTERPWPAVYLPHDRLPAEVAVIASSTRSAGDLLREIQQVIARLDPDLAIYGAKPLRQYVAERMDAERALSSLLSLCGGLALALAGLGLYGVMSFAVVRRTPEIGVRMALGATRRDVVALFVRDALRLASFGLLVGLGPAVALTYAAAGQLVGIQVGDPLTLTGAAAVLIAATVAAAWLPTARATRIDPLMALRAE